LWSLSRAASTSPSEPGADLTFDASSGSSSYRSLSIGVGGSILFWMPSRPAISMAAKARYGLQDGSGMRNSRRLALGLLEYIGMRMQALRLRAEYIRFTGASKPGTRRR